MRRTFLHAACLFTLGALALPLCAQEKPENAQMAHYPGFEYPNEDLEYLSVQLGKVQIDAEGKLLSYLDESNGEQISIFSEVQEVYIEGITTETLPKLNAVLTALTALEEATLVYHQLGEEAPHTDTADHALAAKSLSHLEALPLQRLSLLNLDTCTISMAALAAELPKLSCKQLSLFDNEIDPEGAAALAEGLKTCKFSFLNLSFNDLTDKGILSIAKGIEGSAINTLQLNNNLTTENGLKDFIEALSKQALDSLIVGEKEIPLTIKGLEAWLQGICTLDLRLLAIASPISREADLLKLIEAAQKSKLESLILTCIQIPEDRMDEISENSYTNKEGKDIKIELQPGSSG